MTSRIRVSLSVIFAAALLVSCDPDDPPEDAGTDANPMTCEPLGMFDAVVDEGVADPLSAGSGEARAGRLEEAERTFREALAIHPWAPDARFNLGLLLRQRGRRAEAARALGAALELDPTYGPRIEELFTDRGGAGN